MSKNLADLSFCVASPEGTSSSIWRLWITRKGDVYLSQAHLGGVLKYSFHVSGICLEAFTSEYSIKKGRTDRRLHRWLRLPLKMDIPLQASRVAHIGVPSAFLSTLRNERSASVYQIPSAPAGHATFIELAYAFEDEAVLQRAMDEFGERHLVLFRHLPNGENFFVCWSHAIFEMDYLRVQRAIGTPDSIVSIEDPHKTGRPIRIAIKRPPSDGDCVEITDVGAYSDQAPHL